ncbi:DUF1566 domain-containing protein [Flavobacteriaceae bacterium]|nr:DUF1566 domain-containing protein [Flavobacteriaceae bacterium]
MIKKFFVLLFFCLTFSYAQSPEKFTYQSIIKNSSGYLLKSQDVGLKISVLFNSSNGIPVYSEEHSVESNNNGLVTLIIGDGVSSDVFSDIDWGAGEYFLKVEVDPQGGVNYVMEQTSQLLSVPYALYAGNSGSNLNLLGQDYINLTDQILTINKVDLADDVGGVLPVDNGGTGSSTVPMVGVITAVDATNARSILGLGTSATTDSSDYATAAQGVLADSSLQDATVFATAAQGVLAASSLQGADNSVATDMIADDAVTTAKLANITDGSILIGGASDAPTVVAVSGDVTLANDGTVTIAYGAIALDELTDAKLAGENFSGSLSIGHPMTAATLVTAAYNTAIGVTALDALTEGDLNVAVGYDALTANTTGIGNTAIGYEALKVNTIASYNVAFGNRAGNTIDTGSSNVVIGGDADVDDAAAINRIVIGKETIGLDNNTVTLGNGSITNWLPTDDSEVDLGSSSKEMKNIYVDGVAYLDAIGLGTTAFSLPTSSGSDGQILAKASGTNTFEWVNNSGVADGPATYTVNTFYADLGGYVIEVRDGGKHGLAVAMQNQGLSNWYGTNELLNDPANHDDNGDKFMDWRLPTKRELNLIYVNYNSGGNGASLGGDSYYTSTLQDDNQYWYQFFHNGVQAYVGKPTPSYVRAVRDF